jgi:hypothetical protein
MKPITKVPTRAKKTKAKCVELKNGSFRTVLDVGMFVPSLCFAFVSFCFSFIADVGATQVGFADN